MDSRGEIGIITLVGRFNYGNRLQAYASYRIFEKMGFSPTLLDLRERPVFKRDIKRVVKRVLGRRDHRPEDMMSTKRLAAFDRFNGLMSSRVVQEITSGLSDEYSFFSVGSDQVWNPEYMLYNEDWFFLEFVAPEKRIALAPSIGLNELSAKQQHRLAKGVDGFPRLSIREQRGKELIEKCSGRVAEVICDPTLVLSAQEWRSVACDDLTPDKPYVFTYLLGGVGPDARQAIKSAADARLLPVVSLTDRETSGELPAGPAEFISLIDKADWVITDSFHAAVFSSILDTPLTIVRREGDVRMFSRLETLAKKLGIEKTIFGFTSSGCSQFECRDSIERAIELEASVFQEYLFGCLGLHQGEIRSIQW